MAVIAASCDATFASAASRRASMGATSASEIFACSAARSDAVFSRSIWNQTRWYCFHSRV